MLLYVQQDLLSLWNEKPGLHSYTCVCVCVEAMYLCLGLVFVMFLLPLSLSFLPFLLISVRIKQNILFSLSKWFQNYSGN